MQVNNYSFNNSLYVYVIVHVSNNKYSNFLQVIKFIYLKDKIINKRFYVKNFNLIIFLVLYS
jgi:hypothetical protein